MKMSIKPENNSLSTLGKKERFVTLLVFVSFLFSYNQAHAQAELEPWGNITGIRKEGQLFHFETGLGVAGDEWSPVSITGKERQSPTYKRDGDKQVVTTSIGGISFVEEVQDLRNGKIRVHAKYSLENTQEGHRIFFRIKLPTFYNSGHIQLEEAHAEAINETFTNASAGKGYRSGKVEFVSDNESLALDFAKPVSLVVRNEQDKNGHFFAAYFLLKEGKPLPDEAEEITFTMTASGNIDKNPAQFRLDTHTAGRSFAGLGGNFRLQNPKSDPQVIDYCLKNLRVAWGRVEMPWSLWQEKEDADPLKEAAEGKLNDHVAASMQMARRLDSMHIPFILSAWSAPGWAVIGTPRFRPDSKGVWGNPLNPERMTAIYKSIADYIVYLKEHYGAEPALFSFNESDLGINVRVTGREHAELIKGLGAYFASRGLKTKMLLGDNSDANSYKFIDPAMADTATYPYIGAISFHSWRGWEKETLQKWADAADRLHKPLLVAEGSIDAAAWHYPQIFLEPSYAMKEINLYVRLLAICQPESILQWQLTSDYSVLSGGGIFGNKDTLKPTQRFWNLKQLASTPENLKAMQIISSRPDISCAALGDGERGIYAIHLVNNNGGRRVSLSGIPAGVRAFHVYLTNGHHSMSREQPVKVHKGTVDFFLPSDSFMTLISF